MNTEASRDQFGIVASIPPIRVSSDLRKRHIPADFRLILSSARTFPPSVGDVILFRFYRGQVCLPSNRVSNCKRTVARIPR
jgi:hypothetical protein